MTINLKKGETINLKKEAPSLERVMCGLGWDVNTKKRGFLGLLGGSNVDLDSTVLCVNGHNDRPRNDDVVYFGNLRHRSGAILHQGDNLTGKGDGDDEQILVELGLIPDEISKLIFVVNIYSAIDRQQDFAQVNNAFVRLVDLKSNREIVRYQLSGGEYTGQTGMVMAEVVRSGDGWQMSAIGEGFRVKNIQELINQYLG